MYRFLIFVCLIQMIYCNPTPVLSLNDYTPQTTSNNNNKVIDVNARVILIKAPSNNDLNTNIPVNSVRINMNKAVQIWNKVAQINIVFDNIEDREVDPEVGQKYGSAEWLRWNQEAKCHFIREKLLPNEIAHGILTIAFVHSLRVPARGISCDNVLLLSDDVTGVIIAHEIGHEFSLAERNDGVDSLMNPKHHSESLTTNMRNQARQHVVDLFASVDQNGFTKLPGQYGSPLKSGENAPPSEADCAGVINDRIITIPTNVYILRSNQSRILGVTQNEDDIYKHFYLLQQVWKNLGHISFQPKAFFADVDKRAAGAYEADIFISASHDQKCTFVKETLLENKAELSHPSIVYVHKIPGDDENGEAEIMDCPMFNFIVIREGIDPLVASHSLGHLLGLPDVPSGIRSLMNPQNPSTCISSLHRVHARMVAQRLQQYSHAIVELRQSEKEHHQEIVREIKSDKEMQKKAKQLSDEEIDLMTLHNQMLDAEKASTRRAKKIAQEVAKRRKEMAEHQVQVGQEMANEAEQKKKAVESVLRKAAAARAKAAQTQKEVADRIAHAKKQQAELSKHREEQDEYLQSKLESLKACELPKIYNKYYSILTRGSSMDFVRIRGVQGAARIESITTEAGKRDATFLITEGLHDPMTTFSIESLSYPGHYLYVSVDGKVSFETESSMENKQGEDFELGASFHMHRSFEDCIGGYIAIEAMNGEYRRFLSRSEKGGGLITNYITNDHIAELSSIKLVDPLAITYEQVIKKPMIPTRGHMVPLPLPSSFVRSKEAKAHSSQLNDQLTAELPKELRTGHFTNDQLMREVLGSRSRIVHENEDEKVEHSNAELREDRQQREEEAKEDEAAIRKEIEEKHEEENEGPTNEHEPATEVEKKSNTKNNKESNNNKKKGNKKSNNKKKGNKKSNNKKKGNKKSNNKKSNNKKSNNDKKKGKKDENIFLEMDNIEENQGKCMLVWLKPLRVPDDDFCNILQKGNMPYHNNPGLYMAPGASRLRIMSTVQNDYFHANRDTPNLAMKQWNHVGVCHKDNGDLQVYLDGKQVVSANIGKSFDPPLLIHTGKLFHYEFHPIPVSASNIIFQVKASHDAYLALSSHGDPSNPKFYEIVMGGLATHDQFAIRTRKGGSSRVMKKLPNILSGEEFRTFWASWKGGILTFGRGDRVGDHEIMRLKDANLHDIAFAGVSTGMGAEGLFKLPFVEAPLFVSNPWLKACKVMVSDLRLYDRVPTADEIEYVYSLKTHGSHPELEQAVEDEEKNEKEEELRRQKQHKLDLQKQEEAAKHARNANIPRIFRQGTIFVPQAGAVMAKQLPTPYGNDGYSVMFWIYPREKSVGRTNILRNGHGDAGSNPGIWFANGGTKLEIISSTKSNINARGPSIDWIPSLPLHQWTHVTIVHDGDGKLKVYFNHGLLWWNKVGMPDNIDGPMMISDINSMPANCLLADVRYYHTAIDEEIINTAYTHKELGSLDGHQYDSEMPERIESGQRLRVQRGHEVSNPRPYKSYSIMFWIRPTGLVSVESNILHHGKDQHIYAPQINFAPHTTQLEVLVRTPAKSDNSFKPGDRSIPLHEWSHVCLSVSGVGAMSLYVNGILRGSTFLPGAPSTYANAPLYIGSKWMTPADAELADIRYYRKAVTKAEALNVFQQHAIPEDDHSKAVVIHDGEKIVPVRDHVVAETLPDGDGYTYMFWLEPVQEQHVESNIFSRGANGSPSLSFRQESFDLTYRYAGKAVYLDLVHLKRFEYTHLAFSHAPGGQLTIFVNGEVSSTHQIGAPDKTNGPLFVSDNTKPPAGVFISDMRFYHRPVLQSEVLEAFKESHHEHSVHDDDDEHDEDDHDHHENKSHH